MAFLKNACSILLLAGCIITLFLKDSECSGQWGPCNCNCIKDECDFPQTFDECKSCTTSVGRSNEDASFDDGHCWLKVGNIKIADCAVRCNRALVGCSGFSGYTFYPTNNACWCRFKNPERSGRSDGNFTEPTSSPEDDMDSISVDFDPDFYFDYSEI